MGKQRVKQAPPSRRRPVWRWAAVAIVAVIVAGGASWWLSAAPNASGGTPRLVVDRTEVDVGALPFEALARVVFTLTNAGAGPLTLADVPRVKALKGC